jgi:hypothetical protein
MLSIMFALRRSCHFITHNTAIWNVASRVWFTETHFVEFPCYPSKIIIIKVQITTVKSFEPIGDDLDITIVLQSFHSQITRV